jgi:pantothenate kinase-related protein Tda10
MFIQFSIDQISLSSSFSELLPTFLAHHQMLDKGLNYSLMAVFGPQSSGKSTVCVIIDYYH